MCCEDKITLFEPHLTQAPRRVQNHSLVLVTQSLLFPHPDFAVNSDEDNANASDIPAAAMPGSRGNQGALGSSVDLHQDLAGPDCLTK